MFLKLRVEPTGVEERDSKQGFKDQSCNALKKCEKIRHAVLSHNYP